MLAKYYNLIILTSILSTACDEVDDPDQIAGENLAEQIDAEEPAEEAPGELAVHEQPADADATRLPALDITDATHGVLAGCGKTLSPSVSGGAASWSTTCENGNIRMKGWVKDTSINSKCAWVRAEFADGNVYLSAKACGNGVQKTFDWSRPGSIVDGYLIVNYP